MIEAARAGEAVIALIEGPAGIGKSRLLAQAAEMAGGAEFVVLRARASDLERELPYGIVWQLFEPLLLAELASAGHSNRDIAQTLYVTPKTVEVHLTSIYRKLGISTRAALSGSLAQDTS